MIPLIPPWDSLAPFFNYFTTSHSSHSMCLASFARMQKTRKPRFLRLCFNAISPVQQVPDTLRIKTLLNEQSNCTHNLSALNSWVHPVPTHKQQEHSMVKLQRSCSKECQQSPPVTSEAQQLFHHT